MLNIFSLVISIKKHVAIYFVTVHRTLLHASVNPYQVQNLQIQKEEGELFKIDDNLASLSGVEQYVRVKSEHGSLDKWLLVDGWEHFKWWV